VFFGRVLDLLRGLCTTLGTELPVMKLMSPYASLHLKTLTHGYELGALTEYVGTSVVQGRVCDLIVDMIGEGKVLGMQVYVMHDEKLMLNVCGGMQGEFCLWCFRDFEVGMIVKLSMNIRCFLCFLVRKESRRRL
jgi:hypothetical protein